MSHPGTLLVAKGIYQWIPLQVAAPLLTYLKNKEFVNIYACMCDVTYSLIVWFCSDTRTVSVRLDKQILYSYYI